MSAKKITQLSVVAMLLIAVTASAAEDPRLAKSREITKSFATRLQIALQEAIAADGSTAAITVCKDIAPQIAADESRLSGAKVSRTSLRFRNPGNAPEPWQIAILKEFDAQSQDAEQGTPMEQFAAAADSSARYMKAIPTGPVCLLCHGNDLAPEVQTALDEHYPYDRARGYQLGENRGAFSVVWPAPNDD